MIVNNFVVAIQADDLIQMQNSNLWCLPENYQLKYYIYHYLSWPQCLHVAENHKGKVCTYRVLSDVFADVLTPLADLSV